MHPQGIDFDSHKRKQLLDDLQFLESDGMSRDLAASRLGMSRNTLDKMIDRERSRAQPHPYVQERTGQPS